MSAKLLRWPRRSACAALTAQSEPGLAAIQVPFVVPKAGTGMGRKGFAAAVVGGAAVTGGRGTLLGTLAGVLLLGTIGPALVFLHLEAQWEEAIQGGIILLAIASDVAARRNR